MAPCSQGIPVLETNQVRWAFHFEPFFIHSWAILFSNWGPRLNWAGVKRNINLQEDCTHCLACHLNLLILVLFARQFCLGMQFSWRLILRSPPARFRCEAYWKRRRRLIVLHSARVYLIVFLIFMVHDHEATSACNRECPSRGKMSAIYIWDWVFPFIRTDQFCFFSRFTESDFSERNVVLKQHADLTILCPKENPGGLMKMYSIFIQFRLWSKSSFPSLCHNRNSLEVPWCWGTRQCTVNIQMWPWPVCPIFRLSRLPMRVDERIGFR